MRVLSTIKSLICTSVLMVTPIAALADNSEGNYNRTLLTDVGDVLRYAAPLYVCSKHIVEYRDGSCFVGHELAVASTSRLKEWAQEPRPGNPHDLTGWPSMHTTQAIVPCGASWSKEGPNSPTTFWCFTAATVVGVSRIHAGYHSLEQVLAGAVVGTGIGYIADQSGVGDVLPEGTRMSFSANTSPDGSKNYGMQITYSW